MKTSVMPHPAPARHERGFVYCPICTHTVEADILRTARSARVKDGEKCPRCGSSIGSALVLSLVDRAA